MSVRSWEQARTKMNREKETYRDRDIGLIFKYTVAEILLLFTLPFLL